LHESAVPQGLKDVLTSAFKLTSNRTEFHYNQHYDMDDMAEDIFVGEVDEADYDENK
jgi:hypothetical protein